MNVEICSRKQIQALILVYLSLGRKIIGSRSAYKIKCDSFGKTAK